MMNMEQELPQNMLPSNNQNLQVSLPVYEPPTSVQNTPVYNWQSTKKTLKERFTYLFNNEVLSDVHFIVGRDETQQRIPAHRFILSAGSAVFDAMFNGTLATTAKEEHLPDVEPVAFLSLLRFLYSDEVSVCPDSVMTTLYTAKKYAVPALENHCVEFLKSNLRSDNAFMLLTQARLFDEPQLASMCLEMIDRHTTDAMNAEGFTDIDINTLICVLERDGLRIPELKIFESVVRWSEAECVRRDFPINPANMRSVLGGALSLVRFPLMTVEEFAAGPAQSQLLTDREVVTLFLHFTLNPKPSPGFPVLPRCCLTGKEQTVNRFQQVEGRWGYSGTSDRIRFSTDYRIYIVGLGLYGSMHGPSEYDADVNIIHASTGSVVAVNRTTFHCDGNSATFRVMFKEPAEIIPHEWYIASATMKGPDSRYGTRGMRKVIVDLPDGCFKEEMSDGENKITPARKVTFSFAYVAGQNNGTSVEDGQIPEIIFYT